MWFRVWLSKIGVPFLQSRVHFSEFRTQGLGCRVQDLGTLHVFLPMAGKLRFADAEISRI